MVIQSRDKLGCCLERYECYRKEEMISNNFLFIKLFIVWNINSLKIKLINEKDYKNRSKLNKIQSKYSRKFLSLVLYTVVKSIFFKSFSIYWNYCYLLSRMSFWLYVNWFFPEPITLLEVTISLIFLSCYFPWWWFSRMFCLLL